MLVVDASCLYLVVADGRGAESIRARFQTDPDLIAPHVIDAEVLSVVRRHHALGLLDTSAAGQAVTDLADWPGERFGHQPLLARVWELRDNVRPWDALYVALAEATGATLITLDRRLASAPGPACRIEVPES